jgi:hypothetical protein
MRLIDRSAMTQETTEKLRDAFKQLQTTHQRQVLLCTNTLAKKQSSLDDIVIRGIKARYIIPFMRTHQQLAK